MRWRPSFTESESRLRFHSNSNVLQTIPHTIYDGRTIGSPARPNLSLATVRSITLITFRVDSLSHSSSFVIRSHAQPYAILTPPMTPNLSQMSRPNWVYLFNAPVFLRLFAFFSRIWSPESNPSTTGPKNGQRATAPATSGHCKALPDAAFGKKCMCNT
ncbi:hypothetical protein CROQUDRAFT_104819 [Cronartium quercuum f. sp. fusiforme G11]|uniref:Uncharacterized protein n=1 Tax=Cronartium quercuum f. sp. fusiforme G11 TaxID=708437 RepID=A0A9P6NUQ5_9BASI|nr:hypothetical protein CROQUDRAFT_104819 [Cronartium quercuum f. sp. fusiforme G11]